jgi:hypothetical protein
MVASGCVENAGILLEAAALGVENLLHCGAALPQRWIAAS